MQLNGFCQLQKLTEARVCRTSQAMSTPADQHLHGAEALSVVSVLNVRMTPWETRRKGTERRCHVPESAGRMDFAGEQGTSKATIWTGPLEALGPWVVAESLSSVNCCCCYGLLVVVSMIAAHRVEATNLCRFRRSCKHGCRVTETETDNETATEQSD